MRLSERLHNALFALFLLAMLGYGVAFAAHMLSQFDIINLVRDVNQDDSFYYFEIASNMAEGQFSTFDGGITRTNGYHPLWLWLITPFYWFLDKEAALFAIKALEILLIAGAAMLVAGAARLARLPWILLLGLLPALYQVRALYLGLEAAIGLFMLALFTLALVLYGRDAARWRPAAGGGGLRAALGAAGVCGDLAGGDRRAAAAGVVVAGTAARKSSIYPPQFAHICADVRRNRRYPEFTSRTTSWCSAGRCR